MKNSNTRDVYYSMEEILKKYLPERSQIESMERIDDPYNLGVLLAKTDIKNIKNLLAKQILVGSQGEADD